ncbi:MAG TPA: TlpA disulfide reductase family protein [Vicinamibacterales bacterium]|nr:TlpA disulfide reductase family protein [Vicinamibacterales bacterium]
MTRLVLSVLFCACFASRAPAAAADRPFSCPAKAVPANLNFTLNDLRNAPVALSSFKGKVIALDFWATWCVPCRAEIPGFIELQNKYGPSGFVMVGVSTDDTLALLAPYVASMKMHYTVLQGRGHDEVAAAFGPLGGLPTAFVISRDGKICATHAGKTDTAVFEREIAGLLRAR